ncbi:alpha-tocopherol transfer protein-like isoform X1 [Sitophilus oryzae]|uniref:Alpha-tocopherol transfer protein-like isoform X1 n=1 Tax=Sitophilus oryzae TaxID=7048 RepID=A0A6J2YMC8_SITOR|nr:alpha-tocopherol transfer protein-like isoform X1 [Sitophilus oryzae]XP_030764354.1 alpha-tocopherol transfer protein-like isoform X1 [Sitophilus oryzae]
MNKLIDVNKLYKEDTELKKDDVEMLLKWSEQQRHFPKVTELQAALALHSCFYSIESAKNCLENYFTIRTLCPDYFSSFDPSKNDLLKQQMNVSLLTFLPGTTKNGDSIALTRLMDTNPDVYNPQVGSKMFDMLMMLRMYTVGPTNGIVVVMDMKGSVFMHVTKMNLGEFKKFMVYLQTAMPIRLKQVHFINTVPFMDKLMSMLKPFINKDMFDKIIIHTNNENLYKYVPREAMPVEYGGKADSVDILFEECKKSIYDNLEFYEMLESQVVDENKRVGPRKNVDNMFGFDGTFKKLEVD